jgi:predicted transposase/invertase (TIGR01784 family)
MRTCDESLKVYWDNYSVIETAKNEGRQAGREEGLQEGKEVGASKRAFHIAKEMKNEGLSMDQIVRFTGLSKEQIENL